MDVNDLPAAPPAALLLFTAMFLVCAVLPFFGEWLPIWLIAAGAVVTMVLGFLAPIAMLRFFFRKGGVLRKGNPNDAPG